MNLLEDQISALIVSMWTDTFELPLVPERVAQKKDIEIRGSARVGIVGAFNGRITVACSAGLLREAAAVFFGVQPGSAGNDDLRDAIAEIANIVGGNLKALLPAPSDLTIPSARLSDDNVVWSEVGVHLLCSLDFKSPGELFTVTIASPS